MHRSRLSSIFSRVSSDIHGASVNLIGAVVVSLLLLQAVFVAVNEVVVAVVDCGESTEFIHPVI